MALCFGLRAARYGHQMAQVGFQARLTKGVAGMAWPAFCLEEDRLADQAYVPGEIEQQ